MKVLILEDAKIGGQALQALNQLGISGSWFLAVKSVDNEKLTGVRADRTVETVSLADYGLAIVDGFLLLDGLMGWEVLPSLKPVMFTVGTSSAGDIGAHMEIDKADILQKLDILLASAHLETSR